MSDFGKMAEALRRCSEHKCRCLECEFLHDGVCSLMTDAAAAIEELQAEVKRLEPKRGERTINPYESTWAIENGYI